MSVLIFRGCVPIAAIMLNLLISVPPILAAEIGLALFGGVSVNMSALGVLSPPLSLVYLIVGHW